MTSSTVSSPSASSPESSSRIRPSSTRDASMEPPRKRAKSELNPDQRKEARAHRNRIAAQNSRDKRKAHFAYLEQRINELEEENRRLREGMGLPQLGRSEEQKVLDIQRETAKERENQELKERIKSLESGWSAVVAALQASGLPLNVPAPPNRTATDSKQPPSPTFPVFLSQSPALSNSSLSSSNVLDEFESTRHLARVATIEDAQLIPMSLQRVVSQRPKDITNSHHLPAHCRRRCRSLTTRSHQPLTKWPWRNCYGRSSLPLPLIHQRRLYLTKLSRQLPKSPMTRRPPHPPRRQ